MNRKLKALGLALVAVFAMSAVAASGAQATNFFHSHVNVSSASADRVIITAENKIGASGTVSPHEFTPAPGSEAVKCSSAVFEGTEIAGASHVVTDKSEPFTHTTISSIKTITGTSQTVTPTYSNCTFAGGAASVTTTGCHYRFTSETNGAGQGGVHVECDGSNKIIVSAVGCEIKIGTQTPTKGGVVYTSETSSTTSTRDVKVKSEQGGISYVTNGALSCFLAGIGSGGSEGEYKGEATAKAFEDSVASSTGTYTKGNQLGAWWGPTI
jgi:hypothetical protein